MRRQLRPWLPLLHQTYGVRPWEVDRYTYDELADLIAAARRVDDGS